MAMYAGIAWSGTNSDFINQQGFALEHGMNSIVMNVSAADIGLHLALFK